MIQIRSHKGSAGWWILLLLAIAAGLIYYFYFHETLNPPDDERPPSLPPLSETQELPVPEPEPEAGPAPGQETLPPPSAAELEPVETESLPPLMESDDEALETAQELLGEDPVRNYFVTESVIPRLVASVDALTLEELPKNILPLRGPGGELRAEEVGVSDRVNPETGLPDPQYVLAPANFERYTSQVEAFESADTQALADRYRHYYPLLQQSYRELGYPQGEFQERLMEVIDHLLATPEPEAPVPLVKPEAYYEFADPELQSLSAGQKALIRIGPSNAARVKSKLREIREALQTQRE